MATLLYSATVSLDGFIAGAGGDMSWLRAYLGPNPLAEELAGKVGAIIAGARTYRGDNPNAGDPDKEAAFSGAYHGPQFVLTHNPPPTPDPAVTSFVTDLDTAVERAKAAAGDKYVTILGADVARQCLEAGVLDEVLTIVAPVLLGDGVRLFDHPGGTNVRLERIHESHVPHATNLWYRVVR